MRETACQNFLRKNDKYPANARVVVGGGIFSINSVKCLVKNLIIKYSCWNASPITSGKRSIFEKKRNLSRLREDALADAVVDVFYFQYLGNPC